MRKRLKLALRFTDVAKDLGVRIARMARELTREQVQELFAILSITVAVKAPRRARTMAFHYRGPVLGPLLRDGLIGVAPKPVGKQSLHLSHITGLGKLVLLARIESELPWLLPTSDEEAA